MASNITSKDIHLAAKRDNGVQYLMERFEFSSEEDLYECIRKIDPAEADSLIKKLKKKHKKYSVRQEKTKNTQLSSELQDTKTEEQHDSVCDAVESINIVVLMNQESESLHDDDDIEYPVFSIDELKAQEAELSEVLCELEGEHKELVSERRRLCEDIAKANRAIEELFRLANIQNERVQQLLDSYYECADRMSDIMENQRVYRELLEETRAQIVESEKIFIYLYMNGDIEVENAEMPHITDEEIFAEFTSLYSNQFAGNITINELKGVAKLQKMVTIYKERGSNYELIFDNARVRMLWESLVA